MSYWDTSALLHVVIAQPGSAVIRGLGLVEADPTTSWLTRVECCSAVARLEREQVLAPDEAEHARQELAFVLTGFEEIAMVAELRSSAQDLLRSHPLRAADALHLAAALIWAEHEPHGRSFVCLDARLRAAAAREGFTVLPADPA